MKKLILFGFAFLSLVTGAKAQDGKFGKTPEDSLNCRRNLSLYQGFYKEANYVAALDPWQEVLKFCPGYSIGTYQRGEFMLSTLLRNEKVVETKQKYLNLLLNMYDVQLANKVGNEGYIIGMKGKSMFQYNPKSINEAIPVMKEGIEKAGNETDLYVNYYYIRALFTLVKNGKLEKQELVKEYFPAIERTNAYLAKHPESKNIGDWVKKNIDNLVGPLLKCDEILPIAKSIVSENPDDLNAKVKYAKLLKVKKCNDPFLLQIVEDIMAKEPSTEWSIYLAIEYLAKDKSKAKKYANKTIELCAGNCADKEALYLTLIKILPNIGELSKAKELANELGRQDWKYYVTALQIAARSSSCAENFDKKAMFWLAYDYMAKAKNTSEDESLKKLAGNLLGSYKSRWPNYGDVFDAIGAGASSYSVPCWNGESTSVRTNK